MLCLSLCVVPRAQVLMDINMPVMSGFEALHAIKGSPVLDHVPVILMSSDGSQAGSGTATRALPAGRYMHFETDVWVGGWRAGAWPPCSVCARLDLTASDAFSAACPA
jgi:CheY-like chemotaxis protein